MHNKLEFSSIFSDILNTETHKKLYKMPRKRKRGTLGRHTSQSKKQNLYRSQETEELKNTSPAQTCHTAESYFSDKKESSDLLKCDDCGKTFNKRFNFQRHLQVHSGENSFICSVCNKTFVRKDKLNSHVQTEHESVIFKCSQCDTIF